MMTSDQLNTALRMELINYQATDTLTDDLKRLFLELIIEVGKRKEYVNLTDNVRTYCEAKAYENCCRFAIHYNPDKSENASAYIKTMIRHGYVETVRKHLPSSIVETLEF